MKNKDLEVLPPSKENECSKAVDELALKIMEDELGCVGRDDQLRESGEYHAIVYAIKAGYVAASKEKDAEIERLKGGGLLAGLHDIVRDDNERLRAQLTRAEKCIEVMIDAIDGCQAIGEAYRMDWSEFDGRRLRREINAEVAPAIAALKEYKESK